MNDSLVLKPSARSTQLRSEIFSVQSWAFDDPHIGRFERDVVVHPGAVLILPLVDANHVVMVHNARHAVGRELLELPAGTLEAGEPPGDCAARELQEETGYRSSDVSPLATFHTCPGICTELMHAFVARGLEPGPQRLEPTEHIRIEIFALTDALAMCADGRILDGKTIAALTIHHLRETT